jgi:hypothetical protein
MKSPLKHLLALSLMASSAFMSISDISYNQIYSIHHTKIEQRLSVLVDQRISEQERRLGLHYEKRPKVALNFSDAKVLFSPDSYKTVGGVYTTVNDSISFLVDVLNPNRSILNRVVDHELAHSYLFNKFGEISSDTTSLFYNFGRDPTMMIRNEIIREGFAFYVETKMNNVVDKFKDSEWPNSIDGFFVNERAYQRYQYSGGAHLLRPIIDRFGNRGLEYVITHLPEKSDLIDLPGYQRRVIETLSIDKTCKHCV